MLRCPEIVAVYETLLDMGQFIEDILTVLRWKASSIKGEVFFFKEKEKKKKAESKKRDTHTAEILAQGGLEQMLVVLVGGYPLHDDRRRSSELDKTVLQITIVDVFETLVSVPLRLLEPVLEGEGGIP
jgi:hypothetical protein